MKPYCKVLEMIDMLLGCFSMFANMFWIVASMFQHFANMI